MSASTLIMCSPDRLLHENTAAQQQQQLVVSAKLLPGVGRRRRQDNSSSATTTPSRRLGDVAASASASPAASPEPPAWRSAVMTSSSTFSMCSPDRLQENIPAAAPHQQQQQQQQQQWVSAKLSGAASRKHASSATPGRQGVVAAGSPCASPEPTAWRASMLVSPNCNLLRSPGCSHKSSKESVSVCGGITPGRSPLTPLGCTSPAVLIGRPVPLHGKRAAADVTDCFEVFDDCRNGVDESSDLCGRSGIATGEAVFAWQLPPMPLGTASGSSPRSSPPYSTTAIVPQVFPQRAALDEHFVAAANFDDDDDDDDDDDLSVVLEGSENKENESPAASVAAAAPAPPHGGLGDDDPLRMPLREIELPASVELHADETREEHLYSDVESDPDDVEPHLWSENLAGKLEERVRQNSGGWYDFEIYVDP